MSEIKKSVIMAFVCNPYIAVMQKRLYLKYWKDEVDEVLINVNGRNDMIREWIAKLWEDDKVTFIDNVPKEIRQGTAFDNLYPHVKGKLLITLDSDNFIYTKGIINRYSNLILEGEYDCAGSFGFHAFTNDKKGKCETAGMAIAKYGTVRLNPFMSFWDKNIMDKIENITFGTYNHEKDDKFVPLGILPHAGWMDVMAKVSLEFFSKGVKILKINLGEDNEYTHVGAISSHYRLFFRSLEDSNTQKYKTMSLNRQQMYYYGWHNLIYNQTKDSVPFPEYNAEYEKGCNAQLEQLKITQEEVDKTSMELINKHKNCFD